MSTFQSLPGFREFYPEDCAARNGLFRAWRDAARRFGFAEYDAPVLEPLELYLEKSGEEIRSQLFEFEDKGGRKVALRPEMTPTLARLVAAKAGSLRKPVKWFSIGEQFRYEKPQKGRLRSFYQFNADILGEQGVGADAECIAMLVEALRSCGLKEGEFEVRVSDRKYWFLFCEQFGLNEAQTITVLTILDKWGRESAEETKKKLGIYFGSEIEQAWTALNILMTKKVAMDLSSLLSGLKEQSQNVTQRAKEFQELLTGLKALGVADFVRVDFSIVRGLAYYTGFVFEAFQTVGTARALAGGGRYDDLLKKLGGVDMPAVGFAIGDVTVADLLKDLNRLPSDTGAPDIYLVIGGEELRPAALQLIASLRLAGLGVDYPLKDEKFGKQFKAADQCGAKLAVVLGSDEAAQGVVKIKNMKSGEETTAPNDPGLAAKVRQMLG